MRTLQDEIDEVSELPAYYAKFTNDIKVVPTHVAEKWIKVAVQDVMDKNTKLSDTNIKLEKLINSAAVEYNELKSKFNSLTEVEVDVRATLKAANKCSRVLLQDKKDIQAQLDTAVSCVHNSHEDDIGYDVLCALGQNP